MLHGERGQNADSATAQVLHEVRRRRQKQQQAAGQMIATDFECPFSDLAGRQLLVAAATQKVLQRCAERSPRALLTNLTSSWSSTVAMAGA